MLVSPYVLGALSGLPPFLASLSTMLTYSPRIAAAREALARQLPLTHLTPRMSDRASTLPDDGDEYRSCFRVNGARAPDPL